MTSETAHISPATDVTAHVWTETDRLFVLRLIADARSLGIAEIRFKDLHLRLSPLQNDASGAYAAQFAGAKSASRWATTMPRAAEATPTQIRAEGL